MRNDKLISPHSFQRNPKWFSARLLNPWKGSESLNSSLSLPFQAFPIETPPKKQGSATMPNWIQGEPEEWKWKRGKRKEEAEKMTDDKTFFSDHPKLHFRDFSSKGEWREEECWKTPRNHPPLNPFHKSPATVHIIHVTGQETTVRVSYFLLSVQVTHRLSFREGTA